MRVAISRIQPLHTHLWHDLHKERILLESWLSLSLIASEPSMSYIYLRGLWSCIYPTSDALTVVNFAQLYDCEHSMATSF